jgi:hypothetical protein
MAMQRGPNAWFVAGVATLVGAVIGSATAVSELLLQPLQIGEMAIVSALSGGPAPKLVTPEVTFDFGRMIVGEKGAYEFPFTNKGDAPLELTKGATSCKCTISGLEQTSIPPGETANVKLEWKANPGGPGGDFRQTALILTNDPLRPEVTLTIQGKSFAMWDPFPSGLVFTDLQTDSVASATAKVITYGATAPEVVAVRVSEESNVITNPVEQGDDEVARVAEVPESPFFTATAEPLDATDFASISGATGGFLLTVTTVPPLPIGQMTKQLELVFTVPQGNDAAVSKSGFVPPTEPEGGWLAKLTVQANVVGPLGIAGAQWDAEREIVRMGSLSTATGGQTKLFLTAKGEHRDSVRPVLKEVVPASMRVEVGEPSAIGDGVVVRIPLSISIPAGSPTCNHLGSQQGGLGRIVLDTGHPDVPELTIPVRVAVSP